MNRWVEVWDFRRVQCSALVYELGFGFINVSSYFFSDQTLLPHMLTTTFCNYDKRSFFSVKSFYKKLSSDDIFAMHIFSKTKISPLHTVAT